MNAIGNNNDNSKGEIESEEYPLSLYAKLMDPATENELFADKKWAKENEILDETLDDLMPGSKERFEKRKSQELLHFKQVIGIEKSENLEDFDIENDDINSNSNSNTHSNIDQVLAQQQQQHMMIHNNDGQFEEFVDSDNNQEINDELIVSDLLSENLIAQIKNDREKQLHLLEKDDKDEEKENMEENNSKDGEDINDLMLENEKMEDFFTDKSGEEDYITMSSSINSNDEKNQNQNQNEMGKYENKMSDENEFGMICDDQFVISDNENNVKMIHKKDVSGGSNDIGEQCLKKERKKSFLNKLIGDSSSSSDIKNNHKMIDHSYIYNSNFMDENMIALEELNQTQGKEENNNNNDKNNNFKNKNNNKNEKSVLFSQTRKHGNAEGSLNDSSDGHINHEKQGNKEHSNSFMNESREYHVSDSLMMDEFEIDAKSNEDMNSDEYQIEMLKNIAWNNNSETARKTEWHRNIFYGMTIKPAKDDDTSDGNDSESENLKKKSLKKDNKKKGKEKEKMKGGKKGKNKKKNKKKNDGMLDVNALENEKRNEHSSTATVTYCPSNKDTALDTQVLTFFFFFFCGLARGGTEFCAKLGDFF